MQRKRTTPGRDQERGVIILVVALVLLFIVAAFAALAIDLVTFYTARSEAQLAADSIALAGARILANSGMTSDPTNTTLRDQAEALAQNIALQEAKQNQVGGRILKPGAGEAVVNFDNTRSDVGNPHVIVKVGRADLPTFFARIWGRTQITVSASATAEVYNPSFHGSLVPGAAPVAPSCVKPWLLPNIDPLNPPNPIFDPATGAILGTDMLWQTPPATGTCGNGLCVACSGSSPEPGTCTVGMIPTAWQYYPGSQTDFPAPSRALPACSEGFEGNVYQLSIAGCVQKPLVCGQNSSVTLGNNVDGSQTDADTAAAVTCLTHAQNDQADKVDTAPPQPFQFLAGNDNPVVNARGHDVMVSSSLVTIPVVDSFATSPAKVVGFIQVFLNPDGKAAGSGAPARIVNLAGCGTAMSAQPILGNGGSPVAVRLISQ